VEPDNDKDVEDTSDDTHFDMNQTPKTPPRTPTTDTSLDDSSAAAFSITLFTNVWVKGRVTMRMTVALLTLGLGVMFGLLALTPVGWSGVKTGLCDKMRWVWTMLVVASYMVEVGIEGAGWVVGRAASQFGRGFERGYRV
jgi:hypothetical protein